MAKYESSCLNTARLWPRACTHTDAARCSELNSAVSWLHKASDSPCSSPSPGCVTLDEPVNLSLLYIPHRKTRHLLYQFPEASLRTGPDHLSLPHSLPPKAAVLKHEPSGSSFRGMMPGRCPYQPTQRLWSRPGTCTFLQAASIMQSAARVGTHCLKVTDWDRLVAAAAAFLLGLVGQGRI